MLLFLHYTKVSQQRQACYNIAVLFSSKELKRIVEISLLAMIASRSRGETRERLFYLCC
jgi:hypothetical protein